MRYDYKRITGKGGQILHAKCMKTTNGISYPLFEQRLTHQEIFPAAIRCFALGFIGSYMSAVRLYRCEDKELEPSDGSSSTSSSIINMMGAVEDTTWMAILKDIVDKDDIHAKFSRIESQRYSATLEVLPSIKQDRGRETSIMLYFCDLKEKVTTLLSYCMTEEGSDEIYAYNTINTIFYAEDKYNCGKQLINGEKLYAVNGIIPKRLLIPLTKLMSLMSNDDAELKLPTYKAPEIRLLKNMATLTEHDLIADVSSMSTPKKIASLSKFDGFSKVLNYSKDDWSGYPILDISKREMKFILNYCSKNGYAISDDMEPFNLEQIFIGSKVNYLQLSLTDEDANDTLYHADVDSINHNCRIYFMQVLDGYRAQISIDLENIDKYNLVDNFISVSKIIIIDDLSKIPYKEEDLAAVSPMYGFTSPEIFLLLDRIINILVVMRDRPQRTKIVKCTEKKRISNSGKHSSHAEKEFVIRRILKSTPDAKAYIQKMSSSGERHVEYTMEEWERRAHTRTLKSGKVIYIGETTCHRHKELSTKEIHIKL